MGLRAYGSTGGSGSNPGTVTIADDAGNVFVRGGQGVSAEQVSVMGKAVYISTGNIGPVSMESGVSRTIKNTSGGDDLYCMKATADPADEVIFSSSVNGKHGSLYLPGRYEGRWCGFYVASGRITDGYQPLVMKAKPQIYR